MKVDPVSVSIIVPVYNKLEFTRQCLDRIARHTAETFPYEVIVVDNGSTDGTETFFRDLVTRDGRVRYLRNESNLGFARANNLGARHSNAKYLLFLNNDTLARPGWLEAMIRIAEKDSRVGIVGIKQLFPYTDRIHHTGIVFDANRMPQHLYPHADASLSYVNKERQYQAVTGACLLIPRALFLECGLFDEGYLNGYEDVDLCLSVKQRQRSVVCCTSAFIYHYGQITDTRTNDDDANAVRFLSKWKERVEPDAQIYFEQDHTDVERAKPTTAPATPRTASQDLIYFADDLSSGSALTWATAELALALDRLGAPVAVRQSSLPASVDRVRRRQLERLMTPAQPVGGNQVRWSHYWRQHLELELTGSANYELFVINYLFQRPGSQPWDYWLQTLPYNRCHKLPLSQFCRDVLEQVGVPADSCDLVRPGYAPEIETVAPPSKPSGRFRFLTVTNSHDLERYGTRLLLEAYFRTFSARNDAELVIKDYGAASGNSTLRTLVDNNKERAPVRLITEFTSKEKLIELYKSCDAFVSAHRGEGYGMKILDAMACGLPVITPLFGGPTDFCNAGNCFPVSFSVSPVGDCLDTRSLKITNSPVWAEPDVDSLSEQLLRVVQDRELARRTGTLGRESVIHRFTWEHAARALLASVTKTQAHGTGTSRSAAPANSTVPLRPIGPPTVSSRERSPYWMGLRISVVVPTFNRQSELIACLRALARQSILPQEFEVVVVDDGSTDGTRERLETERFPFTLTYAHQANQGPGAARNAGIRLAKGGLVLFIGDDIFADEHLLEAHLLAHAERSEPGAAILGHIDWPPDLPRTAVMNYVCGDSSLQFAYAHIPRLERLDFRFFYTSNISLKREFLIDAADAGIRFDPLFRHAAFEDSEYAYRLATRGLTIHYCAEALVHHAHWMDLESFARREQRVGQMAVVFYRMHPQLDNQLEVRWIGDWVEAIETLGAQPDTDLKVRALDHETSLLLRSIAGTLEQLSSLRNGSDSSPLALSDSGTSTTALLDSVFATIFDAERTRGKVEEWYAGVHQKEKVETAKSLLATVRKLDALSVRASEVRKLRATVAWLDHDVVGNLRRQLDELKGTSSRKPAPAARLRHSLIRTARRVDFALQRNLNGREPLLSYYQAARVKLKDMFFHPSVRQP